MDRRRNRRGRGHSRPNPNISLPQLIVPQTTSKSWFFINELYNFLVMISLVALIYLMLDYHCRNCKGKFEVDSITGITRSINDIAENLTIIKDNYYDLELKMSRLSQDLPKLEGQIDILEALANTMESGHLGWNPKIQLPLPYVDVYLNKEFVPTRNTSSKKCAPMSNTIQET